MRAPQMPHYTPLQQSDTFTGHAAATAGAESVCVLLECGLVAFEFFPAQIARVSITDQHQPIFTGDL